MNCQGLCHDFLLIHYTKIMASISEKSYPVILGMAPIISHSVKHRHLLQKKAFYGPLLCRIMVFYKHWQIIFPVLLKLRKKYSSMVIESKFPKETTGFGFSFEMLKNRFLSISKVYLKIKFPIIVSFQHSPYQIPVVRVSRKSVTICEKLWVKWLAQHYVWNEVK